MCWTAIASRHPPEGEGEGSSDYQRIECFASQALMYIPSFELRTVTVVAASLDEENSYRLENMQDYLVVGGFLEKECQYIDQGAGGCGKC